MLHDRMVMAKGQIADVQQAKQSATFGAQETSTFPQGSTGEADGH